jgi:PAS domain S-box-containing protein
VASDWIWEVDKNGFYTYSSPKLFDILGYTTEEIIGKMPFDFMPSPEANRLFKIFNDIRASQKSFDCLENINLHKNGHSVILETSGVPIFDINGKFTGLNLTPAEIKVANLIRRGNNAKEIAELMSLSPRTIYNHRKNIRKKLGIDNKETNLRSYLLSIF